MKKILSIAGSDCSGGAGIQADIKTITALKMYAMSVITSLTAQNTKGVFGVSDSEAEFVGAQIDAVFDDIVPNAVKIGMVSNSQIVKIIANRLQKYSAKNIVLDPVMIATSGGKLMAQGAVNTLISELVPLATVITPNIFEAEILSNTHIENTDDMRKIAKNIAQKYGISVLIKGGHIADEQSSDILYDIQKDEIFEYNLPTIATKNLHGTGCTLSSAIACALGAGLGLDEAVEFGKNFVHNALEWDEQIGQGNGAINHYFRIPEAFGDKK